MTSRFCGLRAPLDAAAGSLAVLLSRGKFPEVSSGAYLFDVAVGGSVALLSQGNFRDVSTGRRGSAVASVRDGASLPVMRRLSRFYFHHAVGIIDSRDRVSLRSSEKAIATVAIYLNIVDKHSYTCVKSLVVSVTCR